MHKIGVAHIPLCPVMYFYVSCSNSISGLGDEIYVLYLIRLQNKPSYLMHIPSILKSMLGIMVIQKSNFLFLGILFQVDREATSVTCKDLKPGTRYKVHITTCFG